MTWVTIPDADIDAESPITVALMTALRDNIAAMANGDAGAPAIQTAALDSAIVTLAKMAANSVGSSQLVAGSVTSGKIGAGAVGVSELAANAVHQSELYVAADAQSASISAGGVSYITPVGGYYSLNVYVGMPAGVPQSIMQTADYNTSSPNQIALFDYNGVGTTGYTYCYYIPASPPYDLGDGDIPLFLFAGIENGSGNVMRVAAAEDPPWAYHGPTDIRPTRRSKDGRLYQTRRRPHVRFGNARNLRELAQKIPMPGERDVMDFLAWRADPSPEMEEVEITQAIKNADMSLIPHPFGKNDLSNETIALLSPTDAIMERLQLLSRDGQSIPELLHDGYLTIDNLPLNRRTPPGVNCYGVKFKDTRG